MTDLAEAPMGAFATADPWPRLVTAGELAILISVSRAFVYEHSAELSAIRLGVGPKARLRFDVATAMTCYASKQSHGQNPNKDGDSGRAASHRGGRRPLRRPEPGSILPIRPRRRPRSSAPHTARLSAVPNQTGGDHR